MVNRWACDATCLGTWAGAIATAAAVIVALYVALRDVRVRLRVAAGVRKVVEPGAPIARAPDCVVVAVTNLGRRTAVIDSVFFKRFGSGDSWQWVPPVNPLTPSLPCELPDGRYFNIIMPVEDFRRQNARVGPDLFGPR